MEGDGSTIYIYTIVQQNGFYWTRGLMGHAQTWWEIGWKKISTNRIANKHAADCTAFCWAFVTDSWDDIYLKKNKQLKNVQCWLKLKKFWFDRIFQDFDDNYVFSLNSFILFYKKVEQKYAHHNHTFIPSVHIL